MARLWKVGLLLEAALEAAHPRSAAAARPHPIPKEGDPLSVPLKQRKRKGERGGEGEDVDSDEVGES